MPLEAALRASANATGGWPYLPGRASRIEPTCWALLALARPAARGGPPRLQPADRRHLTFLTSLMAPSGLLVDPGAIEANAAWNGLALLVLETLGDARDPTADGLRRGVLAARGVRLEDDPVGTIDQNNQLQAWAWTEGTFSWVEPTALCLLALKRRPSRTPEEADRIRSGEAVLLDRVCAGGGWNYGNRAVFHQDLRPYVPVTALGLLALQDRADEPAVLQSLDWLVANAHSEPSAMALSLAAVALAVHGRPAAPVLAALRRQHAATGFLDHPHLVAMAQFALTLDRHGAAAFRFPPAGRTAR